MVDFLVQKCFLFREFSGLGDHLSFYLLVLKLDLVDLLAVFVYLGLVILFVLSVLGLEVLLKLLFLRFLLFKDESE